MIKFVYGPACSGKSTYIYNRIIDDLKCGKKPILIVPDQQILTAERAISDMSSDVSSFDVEVLSFRRLGNHVFRKLGGLSFNDIDDGGKLLVMWRVLREVSPFLKTYDNVDDKNLNFTELMLSTVNELKQFAVTPNMLEKAAEKLKDSHFDLSKKLYDISFIFGAYQSFLSKEYNDPTDELTRLAEMLDGTNFFGNNTVYFDSFDSFTPQQYSVIKNIILQASETTFALCFNKDNETGIFNTTKKTYSAIKKMADRFSVQTCDVALSNNFNGSRTAIGYVSENLWNHNISPEFFDGDSACVNTISCHDKFEECEAVVADILKKIRSGVRYKDILIIARDIDSYDGIIDAELENNGIPFYMSRRTDIVSKPIFKLILAALSIKNMNWRYSDVISYLKTGLVGISYDDCDVLENYVSAWNINGRRWHDGIDWNMNPDGFVERITDEGVGIINKANEIRNKIVPPLVKLFDSIGKSTVTEITTALYEFLCELNVKETIELQAAQAHTEGRFTEEKELVQLWNVLINALDTVVQLTGDMTLDSEGYTLLLRLILGNTDIGTIPATIDQVILGSASMLRSGSVDHVYLLGVNEGVFPKNTEENCIFSDSEKNILKSVDVELVSGDELTSDELYWFYKSISLAKKTLTLTYASSDLSGASSNISVAGSRVNFLLNNKEHITYSDVPLLDKIEGKSIALKLLALNRDTEEGVALRRIFDKNGDLSDAIDAFDIPLEAGISDIDISVANDIYNGDISTSQSKIETYVKCSFDYHCRYVLNLKEKKTSVFRSNDIGTFVHDVLENIMARISTDDGIDPNVTDEEINLIIDEIVQDYIKNVCQGLPENTPRLMQLFMRLKRTARLLVKNLVAEFRQSDFVPRFFEMPIRRGISDGVEPHEIKLDDGTKLYLNGIVDRVDTFKKGKDVYVRIVDYKTGTKTFSLADVEKGLNLQMLLYLFAIWNTKNDSFKKKINCEGEILPAGILYFPAKAPGVDINNEFDYDNIYDMAESQIKRSGLLVNDVAVLRAMDKGEKTKYIPISFKADGTTGSTDKLKTIEEFGELSNQIDGILNNIAMEMKTGKVSATPMADEDPCKYCKMKPICRVSTTEEDDEQ